MSRERACRRNDHASHHGAMGHVELDSKSPFVRLINQSHRMSNYPVPTIPVNCRFGVSGVTIQYIPGSRAVDKLNPSHGPSSEAIAATPKDQPISNRFTALVVATVATASDV